MGEGGGCFAQKKLKKIFTWFPSCHPPYLPTLSITQDVGAKIVDPEIQVTGIADLWPLGQYGRQFMLPN